MQLDGNKVIWNRERVTLANVGFLVNEPVKRVGIEGVDGKR